ncbi:low choriolytic enzyme-like [Diretmus argenteus]
MFFKGMSFCFCPIAMFSILQVAVLTGVLCSVQSFVIQAPFEIEHSGNTYEDDNFTVSALIERANVNVGEGPDEPLVMYGDIAMPTGFQNADPCTARGCKWPKNRNGKVYVPYRISNQYSQRERNTILQGLQSFAQRTCIRFFPRTNQRDFVDIQSRSGCFSFVGRRGNAQTVSLARRGCVFLSVIQHELLHALGFDHEQTRSDRDQHVRIQLQNVIRGQEHNFNRIRTRNLGTPYDYNSVMQYGRFAFSRNRLPTIVPIPDPNAVIGRATQMSPTDILRINRLYTCSTYCLPTYQHIYPPILYLSIFLTTCLLILGASGGLKVREAAL